MSALAQNSAPTVFPIRPNSVSFVIVAGLAAFSAYFAMYAFRKPVTASTFSDVPSLVDGLDYKIALILCQVLGYTLSKWIGVRLIARYSQGHRALSILSLIGLSWLALLGFALTPAPWNLGFIFLNGLPLGMVWGFVFAYIEGRRSTEILSSILCASFIFASGAVKSVGAALTIHAGVSAFWMPATTGLIFALPLMLAVFVLSRLPHPSEADHRERKPRVGMDRDSRSRILAEFGMSLLVLISAYVLLTVFRDVRDNFAAEIWTDFGFGNIAMAFTVSEVPIAVFVLVLLALLSLVRRNQWALQLILSLIIFGFVLLGLSTWLFEAGQIGPMSWMVLSGTGLYLAYVPFGTILFDRLIAISQHTANAGFLVYLADSLGYTASAAILLVKHFTVPNIDWSEFVIALAYITSLGGIGLCFAGLRTIGRRLNRGKI